MVKKKSKEINKWISDEVRDAETTGYTIGTNILKWFAMRDPNLTIDAGTALKA